MPLILLSIFWEKRRIEGRTWIHPIQKSRIVKSSLMSILSTSTEGEPKRKKIQIKGRIATLQFFWRIDLRPIEKKNTITYPKRQPGQKKRRTASMPSAVCRQTIGQHRQDSVFFHLIGDEWYYVEKKSYPTSQRAAGQRVAINSPCFALRCLVIWNQSHSPFRQLKNQIYSYDY